MRAFRIPSVLAVVASLALLGCGDLGTGPSLDGFDPEFNKHSNHQGNNDQGEQEPCTTPLDPEVTPPDCDEGDQGDGNGDENGEGEQN